MRTCGPDGSAEVQNTGRRIKSVDDMRVMLSPPWVLASWHDGQEILNLLSKLDKAEKEEQEWEKLKRWEMKKQETIQCREAEQRQKKLKSMEQSLAVSPRGVLSNLPVYNTPMQLMPMTLLVSPILCLSLQLIAMPVRLTVIIGFKFTSCYILPICISTASCYSIFIPYIYTQPHDTSPFHC